MPNHNGLTFAQEAAASHRSYSAVFNSSVPQRQQESAKAAYGRVLGPQAYHVPGPVWAHQVDIRHQTSAFASKTNKSKESRPITADVDFVNKPAMISAFRSEAPGTRSLPWGVLEQRPVARRDKQYDGFLDPDVGTKQSLGTSVGASARGYAASFKSVDNRFKFKEGSKLGPGSYEAQGSGNLTRLDQRSNRRSRRGRRTSRPTAYTRRSRRRWRERGPRRASPSRHASGFRACGRTGATAELARKRATCQLCWGRPPGPECTPALDGR